MKDSKEHILATAFKLFIAKTFKEVTMNEIVQATGLSKGAFYYYFKSKEQLFLEVIQDYLLANLIVDYDQFNQLSLHGFYTDCLNFIGKRSSSEITQAIADNDGTSSNLYTLLFEAIKFFPELKPKFAEYDAYKLKAWLKIIEQAKQTGEIQTNMSDESIAKMFLSSVESTGIRIALGLGDPNHKKERLSLLWDSFYHQLKP